MVIYIIPQKSNKKIISLKTRAITSYKKKKSPPLYGLDKRIDEHEMTKSESKYNDRHQQVSEKN